MRIISNKYILILPSLVSHSIFSRNPEMKNLIDNIYKIEYELSDGKYCIVDEKSKIWHIPIEHTIIVGNDNPKKKIALRNKDVDPYDEEDWGYKFEDMSFNCSNEPMDVGDIVDYARYPTGTYRGQIVWKRENSYLIKFDEPHSWCHNGLRGGAYDDGYIGGEANRYYYVLGELLTKTGEVKNRKFIRRPEIDPYDEEFWGTEVVENKIFEKFGHPSSIDKVKDYLLKFVLDKFDWWLKRKGLANYQEDFVIDMKDIDPSIVKNKDFPLEILVLKLNIVREKNLSVTGGCTIPFRSKKGELDVSFVYRGNIHTEIELKIYTGFKSIQTDKIKISTESAILHELNHIYESYKKYKNKTSTNYRLSRTIFTNTLCEIIEKFPKSSNLNNFINAYYPFTSEHEYQAFMNELQNKKIRKLRDISVYKDIMLIKDLDFEDFYKNVKNDLNKYYKNVKIDDVSKKIVEDTKLCFKYNKLNVNWIDKYEVNFKDLMKILFDDFKKRLPLFLKRTNKYFYSIDPTRWNKKEPLETGGFKF